MVEPQRSIVRFDEASLGRDEPKTNRTGGKAREKPNRHPHGEVLLDNADAVIDALPRSGLLARFRLPPTVHSDCHYRLWQRRYVPFSVFTNRKHQEKLDYMHNNPVTARLVSSPDQWMLVKFSVLLFERFLRLGHGPRPMISQS